MDRWGSGPRLVALFAAMYFAALRPEEAVNLRLRNLALPAKGWGEIPTVKEALGVDIEYLMLRGIFGAPKMPPDAVAFYQEMLKKVLTYHVVAGKWSAQDLMKKIKQGGGSAELTTVEGGKLWAMLHDGRHIQLKDEKGNTALVTIPNVFQSNGVIHVIDAVLMPN